MERIDRTVFLLTLLVWTVSRGYAHADIHYVSLSGSHTLPYTNWPSAATNIQAAVDVASDGDVVLVTNGVYDVGGAVTPGAALANRVVVTNFIVLRSVNGPSVTTILGDTSPVRCVYLASNASLSGFTLSNGYTRSNGDTFKDMSGGGAYAMGAVISNCVISGNSAHEDGYGGGIYGGTGLQCDVKRNSAGLGGGVAYCSASNCVISGNTATDDGPGGGAFQGSLNNCVVFSNTAGSGGGIAWGTVQNCTVTRNTASDDGGGSYQSTVRNSIVYYNGAWRCQNFYGGTYERSCTSPDPGGIGNITAEPLLADERHLLALSACVGAGDYAFCSGRDIDGQSWVNPPSIGCDEYVAGSVTGPLMVAINTDITNVATSFTLDLSADIEGRYYENRWDFGDNVSITNRASVAYAWNVPSNYPVVLSAYSDTYPSGICATVMVTVVQQPVHYVDIGNTSPVFPFRSWSTAATNIQDAIDACDIVGSKVQVTSGVYSCGGTIAPGGSVSNRIVATNAVIVESVCGPEVTIITGQGPMGDSAMRCVFLPDKASITGFTLSNGFTRQVEDNYDGSGGGIYAVNAAVSRCIIIGNHAALSGGGVYGGTVIDSVIRGNSAVYGGGARDAQLHNCVVKDNLASGGGGVCAAAVMNCDVSGNSTDWIGGGSYDTPANNSIVFYNSAPIGSNVFAGSYQYSCTTPDPGGVGNITNEPVFVDYAGGDLHLSSTSMCVNAGNNALAAGTTDIEGNSRIQASIVDMGAYESPYAPIDASAELGGWISPAGRVGVLVSNDQSFAIGANPVYAAIRNVQVDGTGIGSTNSYEFTDITSNHTIHALIMAYPDTNGYQLVSRSYLSTGATVVFWTATNGWYYTLQQTLEMVPAAWSNVPPYTNMQGVGEMVITNPSGVLTSIFYRLQTTDGN